MKAKSTLNVPLTFEAQLSVMKTTYKLNSPDTFQEGLEAEERACVSNITRMTSMDKSTRGRSTEGTTSSIIGKLAVKIFNFDASELLDFQITDKELEYGIEMKNYPLHNDVYASQYVLDYIEANAFEDAKLLIKNSALNVYKMNVWGSRTGKRVNKRINPFREDVFALGMTLLQLTTLKT